MKQKLFLSLFSLAFLSPRVVWGAAPKDLFDLIGIFFNLIAILIPLIFTLALVLFLWGAALYIYKSNDSSARAEGSKFMLYGIIALFVMVGVWGLVAILGGTFGVDTGAIPFLPGIEATNPNTPSLGTGRTI
jgi:hypothetical protein